MYKVNKSINISEDQKHDLAITDHAVVDIKCEYTGNIHIWNGSTVILRDDLHGSVNASGNSVVEYYATIHNGLFTNSDTNFVSARPMSIHSHVIECDPETIGNNYKTHLNLLEGKLNPPLHPACKTE